MLPPDPPASYTPVLDPPATEAPPPRDPAGPVTPLRQRREPTSAAVLLIASFGAFLAFLDSTIVNIAFPDIQADFADSSLASLSWVLNAYNIVFAAFLVAAGRMADLLGRRRVFVVGVVIFTVASVLCAVAWSVGSLIGFRVLQGVGAAMLVPASLALVVEGFDPKRRAHGIALWGAAAAIASGLGPPIGGALVNVAGWRLAFLVNLPLGILAVVAARRGLVESRSPGKRAVPDLRGAGLLAAGIGLVTLVLVQGPEWGWLSLGVLVAGAAGALALVGFGVSSVRHPSPILDPALMRVRSFAIGNLATVVAGAGFYAYLLTHVLWLSYVWDYSLLRAGLAVAPAALVAAVVASVLGKVADAHGHRLVVVPGALVWAGSLLWYLTQVGTEPAFVTEWLPGQLLQGLGVGATLPVLGGAALALLPKGGGYATASAVVSSARQLGAVIGIAVLVVLIGTPTPLNAADRLQRGWLLAVCCFVVVAALAWALGRTTVDDTEDAVEVTPLPPPAAPRALVQPEFAARAEEPLLSDLPLFAGLDPAARERLSTLAEEVEVPAGSLLFEEGDETDALYVVQSGRLVVTQRDVVLTELGRGAVVGELGLLTGERRSASVRALRDTTVLRLTRETFDAVADVAVWSALAGGLARRLQEVSPASSQSTAPAVVVAVLGLDPAAPVRAVSTGVAELMRAHVRVVEPGRVDRSGLEQAERVADKVVLVADGEDQRWWDFCARTADRVVLVAARAEEVERVPVQLRGADLVLVGTTTREQRTAWEERLEPTSTHVVGTGVPTSDLAPLAARLAGRSLGLVLGGGGARAFAHLGVLEELEAAGIRVDRLAGASVGAAVAALSACGWDSASVDAHVYENFVRANPIGDYTVPSRGLIRGRRTVEGLERTFGEVRVEELPKELRIVSVDLLDRSRHVHRTGRVAAAVAASLRLPGLYPPYVHDSRLHVDGGVLDNLPVSSLERGEGPVIAVNIGFGGSGSAGRRDGRPPRVPGLGDTLMRTMMMASGTAAQDAMDRADLVLRPSSQGVGLLEFHQIDRMREVGRQVAREAMEQIEALVAGVPPDVDETQDDDEAV